MNYLLAIVALLALAGEQEIEGHQALDLVTDELRRGEWEQAKAEINPRLEQLVASADMEGESLAEVMALRALANAGADLPREAAWDWDIAVQANFDRARSAVEEVGAVSSKLDRIRSEWTPWPEPDKQGDAADDVVAPRPIHHPQPEFPRGLHSACGMRVLQIWIDRDGIPTRARPWKPQRLGAAEIVVLRAVREWRFEPASRDGEAVEDDYLVTVHVDCW